MKKHFVIALLAFGCQAPIPIEGPLVSQETRVDLERQIFNLKQEIEYLQNARRDCSAELGALTVMCGKRVKGLCRPIDFISKDTNGVICTWVNY